MGLEPTTLCPERTPLGHPSEAKHAARPMVDESRAVTLDATAPDSNGAAEESRTPTSSLGGRRATATPRPHQFRAPPLSSAVGAPTAHEHLLGTNWVTRAFGLRKRATQAS